MSSAIKQTTEKTYVLMVYEKFSRIPAIAPVATYGNQDKLINYLNDRCEQIGVGKPCFTEYGWQYKFNGYEFVANIEEITII